MLTPTPALRIFAYLEPTDMRKSFDGLSGLVDQHLGEDPLSGALFLFCNRRRDRLKLLYWDGDGYALWYKRLEAGTFQLPHAIDQANHLSITHSDLMLLLDGVDLTSIRRRKRFHRAVAS
jgi:transposase